MSLKIRAILVVVIGLIMGLSLSIGGGLLSNDKPPSKEELAWEQARLFAEVLERVKHDYVEPVDDAELLESAIRGMWSAILIPILNTSMPTSIVIFEPVRQAVTRVLALRLQR